MSECDGKHHDTYVLYLDIARNKHKPLPTDRLEQCGKKVVQVHFLSLDKGFEL